MKKRIPLFPLTLILVLLSGSNAMGYYGGGTPVVPTVTPVAAVVVRGTLFATVGPGPVITLKKKNGKVVTQIKSGSWKITVADKSVEHNFHLTGPGAVNKFTTRSEIRTITWTVTLVAGKYNYVCDPHAGFMKGSFTVVNG